MPGTLLPPPAARAAGDVTHGSRPEAQVSWLLDVSQVF